MARWVFSFIVGLVLTALGVYWLLRPFAYFNQFCVQQPCAISAVAAAIVGAIGVFLLIVSLISYRHSRQPQTMTVVIDGQAERDAAAVTELQHSVEQGESAEAKVAAIEPTPKKLDVALQEVFAELPKDEALPKPRKAKAAKKASKKKAPAKKAPAKKKAAKKKK